MYNRFDEVIYFRVLSKIYFHYFWIFLKFQNNRSVSFREDDQTAYFDKIAPVQYFSFWNSYMIIFLQIPHDAEMVISAYSSIQCNGLTIESAEGLSTFIDSMMSKAGTFWKLLCNDRLCMVPSCLKWP